MTWQRITFDADRMGGQPCLGHTRITVATVVRCVASGMSTAEIQEAYPDLEAQDIAEALSYTAAVTEDRVIPFKPTGS